MSLDDWILALHVLSAFAMVAGVVLYSVVLWSLRRTETAQDVIRLKPIARIGDTVTGLGAGGTLLFGLWLAFSVGAYDLWDAWIVAALILWALYAEVGRRTGAFFLAAVRTADDLGVAGHIGPSADVLEANRARPLLIGHVVASAIVLAILVVMIWKPGA